MSTNVVRLDFWIDPSFDEIVRQEPGISLSIVRLDDPDEVKWEKLAAADIYHVSAAKDEVPLELQVTPELLARCPRLKVVSSTGAGYDTIDVEACNRAGVLVVNQAGGNARSVAEHAFAFMLSLAHRVVESNQLMRSTTGLCRENLMGNELFGKVLGLVGIGNIGTRMAHLASAFGMKVLACDPYVADEVVRQRGATPVSLEKLLAESDVVSLHCPRNKETLGMIGREQYAAMKKGAWFISTARGGIHDEAALYEALKSGHLAGAGLDVWAVEPPPLDHPLLTLPNVLCTYHTGGVTHEARRNIATIAAEQIVGIVNGDTPPRMVNPGVFPSVQARVKAGAPA